MPSPTPFEIYDASTSLLRKNKCSTYTKYVSALFLLAPRICAVYFKRLTEGVHLCCRLTKTGRHIVSPNFSLIVINNYSIRYGIFAEYSNGFKN